MLNKIINISAGSDFKKSSGNGSQNRFLRRNAYSSFQFHDSIIFSPALQYLTNIKWRLKEISHMSKGKLAISFIADDIEFQTVVDIPNIESMKTIDYKVIKEKAEDKSVNPMLVEIELRVEGINEETLPHSVTLNNLEKLFSRLFALKIENQLTRSNSVMLTDLIGDLLEDLKFEFDQVNNHLFNFIEKLTESKISASDKKDLRGIEPIKINLIRSLKNES